MLTHYSDDNHRIRQRKRTFFTEHIFWCNNLKFVVNFFVSLYYTLHGCRYVHNDTQLMRDFDMSTTSFGCKLEKFWRTSLYNHKTAQITVPRRRRRRRSRRAQAKASMPASYRHFTVHYFTESHILLLRLPVPWICALKLYITSWLCQNLSRRDLNVLVVLADTTQFGKLFHVLTTLFAKLNLRKSYLTWYFWSLRSFPLVMEVLPLIRVGATHA